MRLIDADGKQLGIVAAKDALRAAEERELDLVEVAPNASPPVCKIMDFGKYKYQISKKQTAKKTQDVKEIKLRPLIDEHDLQLKVRNLRKFLDAGHKVKITMFFRGRERARPELGMKVFDRLKEMLPGEYSVVQAPISEGRVIVMMIAPK
ncbi:MAG: translation initiation factor IF-3 [Thermodesulfovibrionales bacterium]